jgi:hypothetical protein
VKHIFVVWQCPITTATNFQTFTSYLIVGCVAGRDVVKVVCFMYCVYCVSTDNIFILYNVVLYTSDTKCTMFGGFT